MSEKTNTAVQEASATEAKPLKKVLRPSLDEMVRIMRARSGGVRPVEAIDLLDLTPGEVSKIPPQPITVKPEDLWIDGSYQRDLGRASISLILNIVRNWDWRKFKPPVVTKDGKDRYVVIDGQHTAIAAASHPGIDRIPAMFVPMEDVRDQAAAFVSHNVNRINVIAMDKFQARVVAGDENAIIIRDICARHNIVLVRATPAFSAQGLEPNQTTSIATLEKLLKKYGQARFNQIIETASKCSFAPIRADHFTALAILLYESSPGDVKISTEMLVDVITSISDSDALMSAKRIAQNTHSTRANGLAMFWRSKYREIYMRG